MDTIITQRDCTKCKKELPRTEEFFPRNKRMKDGLSSWCRTCHRDQKRVASQADPEPGRRRARQWTRDHPERNAARCKSWTAEHPGQKRESDRRWRQNNPERVRSHHRAWRERGIDHARLIGRLSEQRRRERKASAQGYATDEQIMARIAYYGFRCWMCGKPWEHVDHVIPLALGGSAWPSNLRPACAGCNLSKSAKHPLELLTTRSQRWR